MKEAKILKTVARIRDIEGNIIGTAFLATPKYLLTSAHVVEDALKKTNDPEHNQEITTRLKSFKNKSQLTEKDKIHVTLDFHDLNLNNLQAELVCYLHNEENETGQYDIAVLEINPADKILGKAKKLSPIRLKQLSNHNGGKRFEAYGFPAKKDNGEFAHGFIRGEYRGGWVSLEGDKNAAGHFVKKGYSGGPVYVSKLKAVVGMVSSEGSQIKAAAMIPVGILVKSYRPIKRYYQKKLWQRRVLKFSPLWIPLTLLIVFFFVRIPIANYLAQQAKICEVDCQHLLRKQLILQPNNAEAHYQLALLLEEDLTANLQAVKNHYQQAVKLDENHIAARNNLARLLLNNPSLEDDSLAFNRALAFLREALTLTVENKQQFDAQEYEAMLGIILKNIGKANLKLDNISEAKENFEESLAKVYYPETHCLLAQLLTKEIATTKQSLSPAELTKLENKTAGHWYEVLSNQDNPIFKTQLNCVVEANKYLGGN